MTNSPLERFIRERKYLLESILGAENPEEAEALRRAALVNRDVAPVGDILTIESEQTLSRLHSTVTQEQLPELVVRGYGTLRHIERVKGEAERLVKLALSGNLSPEDFDRLNERQRKMRPIFAEGRQTYQVIEDQPVDLWFPMFAGHLGTGRMQECEYDSCRRIYVPPVRGGRPNRYCSKSCYGKDVTVPYTRTKRAQKPRHT